MMKLVLDQEADAAFVYVSDRPEPGEVIQTRALDSHRCVDYGANQEILGFEFLGISRGVELTGLPYRQELERLFGNLLAL
jgi:uncharacterized protein YuzE